MCFLFFSFQFLNPTLANATPGYTECAKKPSILAVIVRANTLVASILEATIPREILSLTSIAIASFQVASTPLASILIVSIFEASTQVARIPLASNQLVSLYDASIQVSNIQVASIPLTRSKMPVSQQPLSQKQHLRFEQAQPKM